MRNLIEYPVTAQEKLNILEKLEKTISDERSIGDIRPLVLRHVQQDLVALEEALKEVMEWINNWDPPFTQDDEWPGTWATVTHALEQYKSSSFR